MSNKSVSTYPNAGKREFGKWMTYGGAGTLGVYGAAAVLPFIGPLLLAFLLLAAGGYFLYKF